jgi:hypothetical protein
MSRLGLFAGAAALVLLASGGVVASVLDDAPQDAVPVAQDRTADLNRQSAAEAAAAVASVTPAPVAAPAPAPVVVAAPVEEAPREEAVVTQVAQPVEPATPARRQRQPVAIVEAVDKITAKSMRFEVEVGGRPVRFENALIITARACEVSAPDELAPDAVGYLEIGLQPRGVLQGEQRQIFRGWMFASSPAVSGLQHPIYDAWIVGCKA